jgi:magnesium transporter
MEWHNVTDPAGPELDRLAERYHLHPLHVEDCRHRGQSAKVEDGPGYLFTVVKLVSAEETGGFEAQDLDIFLGSDYVITVLEHDCPESRGIVERVRRAVTPELRADQLYYRILDETVDSYLPLLDRYGDTIDSLEDEALESPTPRTLSTIFETKRDLILLRRVLVNTRDVAGHLQRIETPLIRREMWPFLRDVYDHVARNLDTLEVLRDLLNGSLDVYLSSAANRTNQVMKVLTIMGTVALPALVVSGIYGMNLKGLPWEDSPQGLAIVSGVMVAATVLLLVILKRFRWL